MPERPKVILNTASTILYTVSPETVRWLGHELFKADINGVSVGPFLGINSVSVGYLPHDPLLTEAIWNGSDLPYLPRLVEGLKGQYRRSVLKDGSNVPLIVDTAFFQTQKNSDDTIFDIMRRHRQAQYISVNTKYPDPLEKKYPERTLLHPNVQPAPITELVEIANRRQTKYVYDPAHPTDRPATSPDQIDWLHAIEEIDAFKGNVAGIDVPYTRNTFHQLEDPNSGLNQFIRTSFDQMYRPDFIRLEGPIPFFFPWTLSRLTDTVGILRLRAEQ